MPLNVLGGDGSLNFTATINVDQIENSLKTAFNEGIKQSQKFEASLQAAAAGGATALKAKLDEVVSIAQDISPLLEKGLSGIDPKKVVALSNELSGVNDEFEQIRKTTAFIQE